MRLIVDTNRIIAALIRDSSIESYIAEAKEIMDKIDANDTPFIAAALSKNCGIWSDDAHFQKQNKVKAWKTEELLKWL